MAGLAADVDIGPGGRVPVRALVDPRTGNALRSKPRATAKEIETCARCHARRGQFSDAWRAGDRLGDGFRASLIESGLYYDDGQMRDEVFNYGSFRGSRMHAMGVTCSDCHDPHTQKLRLPGNAVCAQCHLAAKYDASSHHHHAPGSKGAECAGCHMPTTTYMRVGARAQWLAPLLADPVREVRMAAARALAGEAEARLSAADRTPFAAALQEYVAAERFNADRPEGRANLGNLYATQGRADEAAAALRSALGLDPSFVQAALSLAELQRSLGQEDEAEKTQRAALQRVRALGHARRLAELEPENPQLRQLVQELGGTR